MYSKILPGDEKVLFSGKIFEVVERPITIDGKTVHFETARRSPGVRLIIANEDKMLLTKEYRTEINGYDYRLPGGKVFDTLEEYKRHASENLMPYATAAAKKECIEETGLVPIMLRHLQTSKAGATVEWDLYYFLVEQFSQGDGQKLGHSEEISVEWKSFDEVKEMCIRGTINEDRSVGVILKYLLAREIL